MRSVEKYTIEDSCLLVHAMQKIDENQKRFLVVVDTSMHVIGMLTDGDIRRRIIKVKSIDERVKNAMNSSYASIDCRKSILDAIDLMRRRKLEILPVVTEDNLLVNIVTKTQLESLMLTDTHASLVDDFEELNTELLFHDIHIRPWGFYKTTLINEYFQSKIISVAPSQRLSLQKHFRREEYWIVTHGEGLAQIGNSVIPICVGSNLFIPKDCLHRLTNTSESENLIITEVQIGDYFGEDDIHRYEDVYGRV